MQEGLAWKMHRCKTSGDISYELVGFADEYDLAKAEANTDGPAEGPLLAKKVLQLMVRSVGSDFSMPVAFYEYRCGQSQARVVVEPAA